MLARILVQQGRLNEALEVADRALSRVTAGEAPPVVTLASTRGDILARLGRTREAEAAFREEIARFPTTRQAYIRLSILMAEQHRFSEIEPALQAMVEASPSPSTFGLAARVMADLGNEEGARRFRRKGEQLAAQWRRSPARG
jgi:predicted Zn-dependent protease